MRTFLVPSTAVGLTLGVVVGLAIGAPGAAGPPLPASAHLATVAYPYELPPLPYDPSALAPVIDTETMEIHHGLHHQAYVDALNEALEEEASLRSLSLEALLARASSLPTVIRNNAGGHWNHTFFWTTMTAPGSGGEPGGALLAALERDFGSLDAFRTEFQEEGAGQFGSGWVWLIMEDTGRLRVVTTPQQDNPLMDAAEEQGTPLMGNDVWEHAYYLTYRNRRADYLSNWWEVVDWAEVSRRYDQAVAGG